jgi:hypothetical protein
MQKWEYNLLVQSPNTECARCEEALNGLGRDGWELVTFYVNGGDSQCPLCYFRNQCFQDVSL